MGRYTSGTVARDILAGAAAGIAAIYIADKLDTAMYKAGGPESIRKTEAARPNGMDPAHVLAKRAADATGVTLENPKNNQAGQAIHYGIAATMGALYGLLRGMAPGISTARGAPYGLAMFVLHDEIANTAMGTAGNPLNYPIRDHLRGAATHALYGILTDLGTRIMSPWRDEVVIEHGPPLAERWDRAQEYLTETRDNAYNQGRQTLDQARGYLDQGRAQARGYADQARTQAREYLDQGRTQAARYANQARANLPEIDTDEAARRARRYANQAMDTARANTPNIDRAALARQGRHQANRVAEQVRPYVAELDSGFQRAIKRLFG